MKNLWPDSFQQKEVEIPETALNMQGEILLKMTEGKVFAEAIKKNVNLVPSEIRNDFNYEYKLIGKSLKDYSYRIFYLSYPITIYPLNLKINKEILSDIESYLSSIEGVTNFSDHTEVENEASFSILLGIILTSNRMKDIVSSILKLSDKNQDKENTNEEIF